MKLFDSHCHLTDPPLRDDLDGVLARAEKAGVDFFLVPGYDLVSSRQACRLAGARPGLYAAVGKHPAWLGRKGGFSPEPFRQLARLRRPVAIGEIGLDYALEKFSPGDQEEALRAQLELAGILGLPVLLHCRRAFEPLYLILRDYPGVVGVLHAYGGGPKLMDRFLELGYYIGFGGGLTRPGAKKVRACAADIPAARILLETDAPYIGTHFVAKGATEPRDVASVAAALAGLRGWTVAETARLTTANAFRFLGLAEKEGGRQ